MSGEKVPLAVPVVTLDGWSGSGKSTLARALARRLGWTYLDSGAWYRALAWAVLREGGDPADGQQALATLFRIRLDADASGTVTVDGRALSSELRTPRMDRAVSQVADHPAVRAALNERMRACALRAPGGLVADGRDAGSVIFPEASLKVFVAASLEERARRRAEQRGEDPILVLAELAERDRREGARGASAPRAAQAEQVLENETLTVEEAVGSLLAWIAAKGLVQAARSGSRLPPEVPPS
jgi:cytidylate kinase